MHRIFESIYFYFRSLREAAGRPVLNLNKKSLSHTLFVFTAIIRAHINFTIYNRNFTDAMDNHTSADFKNIAEPLCDEVSIQYFKSCFLFLSFYQQPFCELTVRVYMYHITMSCL